MNAQAAHPSAEQISAYALGKLDEAAAAAIHRHLETCEPCRQSATSIPADTFVNKVRSARDAVSVAAPTPAPAATLGSSVSSAAPARLAAPITGLPPELASHPKFHIVRELGRGGMGVVYQAEHRLMKRPVAIKVLNPRLLDNPTSLARFHQEVEAAAQLSHPNIVAAHDAEQAGDLHLLVMEYVEGQSLAQVLERKGPLPIVHACKFVWQAAKGLQHAFDKKMVHRDIKPQNLMLTPQGVVKILDFGLARLAERPEQGGLTQESVTMGTPEYMAPEQATDARQADIRSDIYSLGCTLYCLLSGRPPFPGETAMQVILAHMAVTAQPLQELRPEVPADLAEVVVKMMAKEPKDRYQTPAEVMTALAPFCKAGRQSITEQAEPFADMDVKGAAKPANRLPPSRGQRKVLLTALAVVAALGLGGWLLAGLVFKVKTPEGMIVVEVNEPGAEVFVDGQKISIHIPGDNQPVEIRAEPGQRKLRISKAGFVAVTRDIELTAGKSEPIRIQLDPEKVAGGKPTEPPPANRKARIESGSWKVEGDELVHTDPTGGNCRIFFGDPGWTDYDYSFEVVKTAGPFGVAAMFRAKDPENWLLFDLAGWQNRYYTVESLVDKQFSWIHRDRRGAMARDRKYRVLVKARGTRMQCFLDDVLIYEFADNRHARGAVGLRCWGGAVRVSALRVSSPDGKVLWQGPPDLAGVVAAGPADQAPPPGPTEDGFEPLFNGKDLTGWKVVPGQPNSWKVEDGAIVSIGPKSALFTERGDYANFHFRVEAMINPNGNSGQFFRANFVPFGASGYEADISNALSNKKNTTGSLIINFSPAKWTVAHEVDTLLAPPNKWFTQEVIADGNRITILVNGQKTTEFVDLNNTYKSGYLALEQFAPQTVVRFRKVEIKELPPTQPADGFEPLFNRTDFAGWQVGGASSVDWKNEGGVISGTNRSARVGSGRSIRTQTEYDNFHLRCEVRAGQKGTSHVRFRAASEPAAGQKNGYMVLFPGLNAAGIEDGWGIGSLHVNVFQGSHERLARAKEADLAIRPGDWYRLEIIADGQRLQVLINGKTTVEHVANDPKMTRGYIMFNCPAGGQIVFRNVEIKELAGAKAADAGAATPLHVLEGHKACVRQVQFTPDGSRLVSGSYGNFIGQGGIKLQGPDNSVRVWNLETGKQFRHFDFTAPRVSGLQGLSISPNGQMVAACTSWDSMYEWMCPWVYVWDIDTGVRKHFYKLANQVILPAVTFSADGATLRVAHSGKQIVSWSLANDGEEARDFDQATFPLTFAANGKWLLGSEKSTDQVWLWDATTGARVTTFAGHVKRPRAAAVSKDEKRLLTSADDFSVRLWDIASAKELTTLKGLEAIVRAVAFCPDGNRFVTGDDNGVVRLWHADTGKELARFTGHTGKVRAVAVSPDGKLAASGGEDLTIRIWQLPAPQ